MKTPQELIKESEKRHPIDFNELESYKEMQEACLREVNDTLDLGDSYALWMSIENKDNKNKKDIPKELYPILDSFWESMKRMILSNLNKNALAVEGEK